MTTLPQTTPVRLPQSAASHVPTAYVPGASGATSTGGIQMSFSDVMRIIRANMWLIIIFLCVSAVAGYGLHRWLAITSPRYEAKGYLQVNTQSIRDITTDFVTEMTDTRLLNMLRTQSQLLMNDSLFLEVLRQAPDTDLGNTRWYKQYQRPTGFDVRTAKENLQDHFRASPITDSQLLSVSFETADAKDARVVVLQIADLFIKNQLAAAEIRGRTQTAALAAYQDNLVRKLSLDRQSVREKAQTLGANGLEGGVHMFSTIEAEVRELIAARFRADALRAEAVGFAARIQHLSDSNEVPSEVDRAIEMDNTVASFTRDIAVMEVERDALAKSLGPQHTAVRNYDERIELSRKKVADRRAELRIKYGNDQILMAKGQADSTTANLEAIDTELKAKKANLTTLSGELAAYLMAQDEEKADNDLYQKVSAQLRNIQASASSSSQAQIDWANGGRPETPDVMSFPKLKLILPVSMLVGLMLALGIAFLREIMDETVRSPRDVARVGQMNLLGIIADEADDPQVANAQIAIFDAPHSKTAEQFRELRTRLQHAIALDTTRSIMVTGPSALDGKTTVASNLAAGLALNGRKILLVDANFRRPELYRIFGMGNERGFSDVLNGTAGLDELAQASRIPNLFVLTSGPKPSNATELFESQLLLDFIEHALEEFDHVIFDSGPFLVVSESIAMAPRVDGVVTVVRAHSESRGLLQRLRDSLRQVKAEHIGVVLNAVRAQGGGYYRSNIKAYYDYQRVP